MTKTDFLSELSSKDLNFLVNKWVLERSPFVFNDRVDEWIEWKNDFSERISVDSKSIIITGSACTGFSLNPEKNYRDFNEQSDIDVAIVSSHFFDVSWLTLRNLGTKRYKLSVKQKAAIDDHVHRLIYWGTIGTDKLLDIMPYGKIWIKVLSDMSNNDFIDGREIKIRIYRNFESLNAYHMNNMKQLKNKNIGGVKNEIVLEHNA